MDFALEPKNVISLRERIDRRELFKRSAGKAGVLEFSFVPGNRGEGYQTKLKPGQYGCKKSHLDLVVKARTLELSYVIILEDDAEFDREIVQKMDLWWSEVPEDWDMVYLGAHNYKPLVMVSEHVGRCAYSLSTVAYIVRNTAYKLITELLEQDKILDMIYVLEVQPRLKCYCFKPNLVTQAAGFSDIQKRYIDYGKYYR